MKQTITLLITLCTLSACSPESKPINFPGVQKVAVSNIKMADLLIHTQRNTPVEFQAEITLDNGLPHALAADENKGRIASTPNGTLEVIDQGTLRLRYTPKKDYSGEDYGTFYLIQENGAATFATVRIQIDNPIRSLQPALAVRATGCIMCHASVKSNVITDFGFGDSFFFGGPEAPKKAHTSIYSDEASDPNWKLVNSLGAKVIVPYASTTNLAKVQSNTLSEYLSKILSVNTMPSVRKTEIIEASEVFIGAPTPERIRTATKLVPGQDSLKFIADPDQTTQISGLLHKTEGHGDYYTNDVNAPLICSGDLAIDGVLYLNNVVIQTQTGCRIYATKSVFISGPITYKNGNEAKQNLQIVSGRSINMGLGKNTCKAQEINGNSLTHRLKEDDRRKYFFTRANMDRSVQDNLDNIYDDANQIGVDTMLDAACEPNKRKVAFSHLILNAPIVFSRYQGDFKGSIIAEIALMSLDHFIFEFDPLFSVENVLPLLNPDDYLKVKR